jgi:hexosaminidase
MNTLHWHLTEDQGWRLAIDKYPKLQEVAAWRTEKDGSRYGGFYTKKEIKEIVAYAERRNVRIIPEIEMPGHSQAAIAAYPWLSCTGKQVEVANDWGVFKEIYCAGNDSVFTFIEDVLVEVMQLFPSKYIHIGGDEAPKYRWEHCDKCQKRMADFDLKDEHELQSFFISHIEEFLNENGRQLIGWDEILEGGLSPNATVQCWRGKEFGQIAAEMGHDVIMSPTSHCYLDYGLDAINVEHVYNFNPIPKELPKDKHKHIIGGEANMWTEHVPNDSVLDSKVFPRVLAMAEVLWSGPDTGYVEFYDRLQKHYPILDAGLVKYGLEAEPVMVSSKREKDKTFLVFQPGVPNLEFKYSYKDTNLLNHDIPYRVSKTLTQITHLDTTINYVDPIALNKTGRLDVQAYKNGEPYGTINSSEVVSHKALGIEPSYKTNFSKYYTAGGNSGLTDGLLGTHNFRDGKWQGFSGTDVDFTLDFGKEIEFQEVALRFYQYNNAWILQPDTIEIHYSKDNKNWNIFTILHGPMASEDRDKSIELIGDVYKNKTIKARYVQIFLKSRGPMPAWHEAAGSDSWIFIDEVIVR